MQTSLHSGKFVSGNLNDIGFQHSPQTWAPWNPCKFLPTQSLQFWLCHFLRSGYFAVLDPCGQFDGCEENPHHSSADMQGPKESSTKSQDLESRNTDSCASLSLVTISNTHRKSKGTRYPHIISSYHILISLTQFEPKFSNFSLYYLHGTKHFHFLITLVTVWGTGQIYLIFFTKVSFSLCSKRFEVFFCALSNSCSVIFQRHLFI